jgi:hypothetical protein
MVLFDIQSPERAEVAALVQQSGMPLMQQVPIVTTRIEAIDGMTKARYEAEHPEDTTRQKKGRRRFGPPQDEGGAHTRLGMGSRIPGYIQRYPD